MRGTPHVVNQALSRPLLIGGVEKSLVMVNAMITYLLLAASHFHYLADIVGAVVCLILHSLMRMISKHDPFFATIIRRNGRYWKRPYFPAKSHPSQTATWPVYSVEN